MHHKRPGLPLIICADDDADTEGNPGLTKANQVALAIGAKVAVPKFGDRRPIGATDFNDMAALLGLEAVAGAIRQTTTSDQADNDSWLDPLPLTARIDPEPYPLDAPPDRLRAAVEEVCAFTKAHRYRWWPPAAWQPCRWRHRHADAKRGQKSCKGRPGCSC